MRLLEDLPAAPAPRAEDPARAVARARLAHRAGAAAIASLLCVGIWAAAGASGSFWPIWVILVAAIGLAREGWRTLGPGGALTDEELGERRRRGGARWRRALYARGAARRLNSIIEGKEAAGGSGRASSSSGVCAFGCAIARVSQQSLETPEGVVALMHRSGCVRATTPSGRRGRCCGRRAKCAGTPRPPAGAADARGAAARRPPPPSFPRCGSKRRAAPKTQRGRPARTTRGRRGH